MTDNEKNPIKMEEDIINDPVIEEEMHLDDARRIKVLSPGMLVFKRFIRNSLAVVGFGILFFMFTFAFLGPLFSPYSQTQVFKGIGSMSKDYAGATYNTELRYTVAAGEQFGSAERAQFLLALGKKQDTFSYGDNTYYFASEGNDVYRIMMLHPIAVLIAEKVKLTSEVSNANSLEKAILSAVEQNLTSFNHESVVYRITKNKKELQISTEHDVALAMLNVYDTYDAANAADVLSYAFRLASIRAVTADKKSFSVDDRIFKIVAGDGQTTILDNAGNAYAEISNIIVNPLDQSLFLPVVFKASVRQAINDKQTEFTFVGPGGEETEYRIVRVNNTYNIKTETPIEIIRQYEAPSAEHPLGLDNNGMDLMTRLMYGGRVSLLVGFVVIFLEVFIGIIVGGISGYFGGWVDTGLMRFVDLFNSIPFYPMVLIFGSVMDALEVEPMVRIFLLMAVLGILGWTGVARVVRGQILSLREQDFMIATEATGIRTSRRIFKHLVPNVMPLLIVQATAGLGGIIITEATLGFLGLGIKYPLASWGSIINVASDAYVMTNFWFMWLPAGMLILLTVLGFNFVGDGLRDAYDPKMKR